MNSHQIRDARLEIKFVTDITNLHKLENWLKFHVGFFYTPYPDRWVNNAYFDTYCYQAYAENLAGGSVRTKVRYRWYGESLVPSTGALEVKCKRNVYGWKLKYAVEENPVSDGTAWRQIKNSLINQIEPDGGGWIKRNPQPMFINQYKRQYFVSRDEKIRATIDTNQVAYDQRYSSMLNVHKKSHMPSPVVVEFKFSREDRDLANSLLQGFPLRVSRHSKFVTAINSIKSF